MRLFAEEKRSGTSELLLTSPIRDSEIIIGKWLAALMLYVTPARDHGARYHLAFAYGKPDWKPIALATSGSPSRRRAPRHRNFHLFDHQNQIIAGAATFAVCLLLWVFEWVAGYQQAAWAKVMAYMSVVNHLEPFTKGVVDTKDVIFLCP